MNQNFEKNLLEVPNKVSHTREKMIFKNRGPKLNFKIRKSKRIQVQKKSRVPDP